MRDRVLRRVFAINRIFEFDSGARDEGVGCLTLVPGTWLDFDESARIGAERKISAVLIRSTSPTYCMGPERSSSISLPVHRRREELS